MAADAIAITGRPRLATVLATAEVVDRFRAALAARDIVPPESIIADGTIHRCEAAGKNCKGDAAYLLHLDGIPAGGVPWLDAATLPIYSFGKAKQWEAATMFVKITAKRQVTFPARVLEALGVKPGDRIELEEGPGGFVLRARQVDRTRLAPLRDKLSRGKGTFDLEVFRNTPHDRALRD